MLISCWCLKQLSILGFYMIVQLTDWKNEMLPPSNFVFKVTIMAPTLKRHYHIARQTWKQNFWIVLLDKDWTIYPDNNKDFRKFWSSIANTVFSAVTLLTHNGQKISGILWLPDLQYCGHQGTKYEWSPQVPFLQQALFLPAVSMWKSQKMHSLFFPTDFG